MSVVNKKVQCVHHLSVIANQGHFDGLLDYFDDGLLCFGLFLQQFDLHLLFGLFHKEIGFPYYLLRLLNCFLDEGSRVQNIDVVLGLKF